MGPGTALVTGGTGFVGSHLARRLATEGWELHLIVRPGSNLDPIRDILGQATLHAHDGSSSGMARILETARPDVVFHLASLFLAQHRMEDIGPMIASNVLFPTQLLDAMAAHGARRLINTGTQWQHYEDAEYSPVCLYAATKQAFEAIIRYYVETSALRVVTLKLFDTYGPNDPRPKLFRLLEGAARERKSLSMSPGEQKLDLVYIDDVVKAFVVAARRLMDWTDETGGHEAFAVSSGNPLRLKDLVQLYERAIGRELPIEWAGRPYRVREVMAPWGKGSFIPGWKPEVPIEEGIRRVISLAVSGKSKDQK